jgi:phosphatidylglycerophosphate synthase
MTAAARRHAIRVGALALGVILFFGTLYYINFRTAFGTIRQLGLALPLAIVFSGLWHLTRTWAWAWCFPQPRAVGFLRLVRIRLSAEAFSYLTLRGIAGEPLKVVLLADRVDARQATAAVALERLAYLVATTIIVGIASLIAIVLLPLTRIWFRVFRAFAIAAAVVTMLTGLVISGRGTYLQAALRRLDSRLGTGMNEGRIGRFVGAVERQMLDLVRGNPKRLMVLLVADVASYVFMVLEAWVILRASGNDITAIAAFAVETFSRVASFASAFIPANLGALEASSLAAVAAVGGGGGAALALARRLRGLFWAGLGLAIYPRGSRPAVAAEDHAAGERRRGKSTLLYLPFASVPSPGLGVDPATRLAGLPISERVTRSARRAGYGRVIVWLDPRVNTPPLADGIETIVARTRRAWHNALAALGPGEAVTVVGPGTVVSPALLSTALDLRPLPGHTIDVAAGDGWPESGVLRMAASDAADVRRVAKELMARRARALPLPAGIDVSNGAAKLALRIDAPADVPAAEETIRRSSYKDTDATVARFNRRLSLPISIALIRTPLTANQLSVILVALGFYSAWLFSLGRYWTGVLGAFLSLAASVLDGCDGEIARLKYQESALGCWIETIGDYSYYIAIFIGLTIGAVRQTGWEGFYWIGGVALTGTLAAFALLIYLRGKITNGRPEKLHSIARARFKAEPTLWSRVIWRISFVATRAAMPYGIAVFALFHLLPGIVVLAAIGANIYWISLVIKLRDLLGPDEEVPTYG